MRKPSLLPSAWRSFAGFLLAALLAVPAQARTLADVPYGKDGRQRMDIYLPDKPRAAALPVILMVHGGAWRTGSKAMGKVVRNKVAHWVDGRGLIFISVNYRLLPDANPLEQADDIARAIAAAQAAAPGWGGDPKRFMLMGHSAGAHLVALLNASPSRAAAFGAQPWLGTVALDSALMDVAPTMQRRHLRFYDDAFGSDPAFWHAASPQQQWKAGAPPLLAVCSTQRQDRPCTGAEQLARHAAGLGGRVEVLGQDRSHAQINDELGLPGAYTDAVEAFMKSLDPALAGLLR